MYLRIKRKGNDFTAYTFFGEAAGHLCFNAVYGGTGGAKGVSVFRLTKAKYLRRGVGRRLMEAAKAYYKSIGETAIYTVPIPETLNDGNSVAEDPESRLKYIEDRYKSYGFVVIMDPYPGTRRRLMECKL